MKKILFILAALLVISGCSTTQLLQSLSEMPAPSVDDAMVSVQVIDYKAVQSDEKMSDAFAHSPYKLPDADNLSDAENALLGGIEYMVFFNSYDSVEMLGNVYSGTFTAVDVAPIFTDSGYAEEAYGEERVYRLGNGAAYLIDGLMVSGTTDFVNAYLDVKAGTRNSMVDAYPDLEKIATRGYTDIASISGMKGLSEYQYVTVGAAEGTMNIRMEILVADGTVDEIAAAGRTSMDTLVEIGDIPSYTLEVEGNLIVVVVEGISDLTTIDF